VKSTFASLCLIGIVLVAGCGSAEPGTAVVNFLRAVEQGDTTAILQSITVEAPYSIILDTGLVDTGARADTVMVVRLLTELLPGGSIHTRWYTGTRMIVGASERIGSDSALVEVTRLDQESSQTIYNKFGLVDRGGLWQIYSFKTRPGPSL
jgi:hypothetical protein